MTGIPEFGYYKSFLKVEHQFKYFKACCFLSGFHKRMFRSHYFLNYVLWIHLHISESKETKELYIWDFKIMKLIQEPFKWTKFTGFTSSFSRIHLTEMLIWTSLHLMLDREGCCGLFVLLGWEERNTFSYAKGDIKWISHSLEQMTPMFLWHMEIF